MTRDDTVNWLRLMSDSLSRLGDKDSSKSCDSAADLIETLYKQNERLVMAAETLVHVMQNNASATTSALMDLEDALWGLQNTQQEQS